jgi:hypothetical protein
LLIATLRDDIVLDVETKILENSFVTIINDEHWFVTQFALARKIFRLNLLPFSPKILTFSLQKFVAKPFKNIGICTVLSYEGGGGQNLEKSSYLLYGRPLIWVTRVIAWNSNENYWYHQLGLIHMKCIVFIGHCIGQLKFLLWWCVFNSLFLSWNWAILNYRAIARPWYPTPSVKISAQYLNPIKFYRKFSFFRDFQKFLRSSPKCPSTSLVFSMYLGSIYPKNHTWAISGVFDFPLYIDSARFSYGMTIKGRRILVICHN